MKLYPRGMCYYNFVKRTFTTEVYNITRPLKLSYVQSLFKYKPITYRIEI